MKLDSLNLDEKLYELSLKFVAAFAQLMAAMVAKDEARRVTCRIDAVDATYELAYYIRHGRLP
jgi:hypothetical protein